MDSTLENSPQRWKNSSKETNDKIRVHLTTQLIRRGGTGTRCRLSIALTSITGPGRVLL